MASNGGIWKKVKLALLVLGLIAGIVAYIFYRAFYYPGIRFADKSKLIYVHTGWDFDKVMDMLQTKHILRSPAGFKMLAGLKDYKTNVKPGRYRVVSGMSNAQLINLLMSGKQEPENLSLYNIRTKQELIDILKGKMEADSVSIAASFTDAALKKYGLNSVNVIAMFLPGTYQLLWTDKPDAFMEQMHNNYEAFWTEDRRKAAAAIPLTPLQVSILASIVQAEQGLHADEKAVIAGLYINRLKINMALQSDPTLIYARGDFSIMRVRDGDKKIDSPFNTYMYTGLPPGPINMPDASSIDAVLHYQKSNYLYMCAECDLSGRTHFSTTLKEQEEYAAKYQQALNKRNIIR